MFESVKSNNTYILNSIVIFIISVVVTGCGGGKKATPNPVPLIEQGLIGKAQKGNFLKGAQVTATKLNALATHTNESKSSIIANDLGGYSIETTWEEWTELRVTGRFFDEYTGSNSPTELSLISIIETTSASKNVNVNLFTHFVATRIRTLVNSGVTINQARDTAQIELRKELQLLGNETNAEKLDLTNGEGDFKNDNAILLLFSGGFMANEGSATTLLTLADDFAINGKFDENSADLFEGIGNYAGGNNNFERLSNNLKDSGIENPPEKSDLIALPKWANQPPQANVSPAFKTIIVGRSITLSANSSFDPDGDQLSYVWEGNGTSACGNNSQCRLNGLSVGVHSITMTVTDEHGSRSKSVVSEITVNNSNAGNKIPVAVLSVSSSEVRVGATIGLDASRSFDEDGSDSDLVFNWFGTGTSHCGNNAMCVLSNLGAGTYFITVQVEDLEGGSDSADGVILVNPDNIAPIVNAGADKTIFEGQSVSLSAFLSTDTDGTIAHYAWTVAGNSSPLGLQQNMTLRNLSVGTHNIRLTVTDNQGASNSDTVRVVVRSVAPVNNAPNANAGNDRTINIGDSITLSASQSNDPDGNIVSYQWRKGSNIVGQSRTLVLNNLPVGTHRYFLRVTDNDGATDEDNVTVRVESVNNGANQSPNANAGSDQTINAGDSITLNASQSNDPDGNIVSYQWRKGSNTVGRSKTLVLNNLPVGVHQYSLRVTDDDGAIDSDTVVITVEEQTQTIVVSTPSTSRCTSLGLATYTFQGGVTGTGTITIQPYAESNCTGGPVGSPIVTNTPLTYSLANIVVVNSSVITADMTISALGQTRVRRVTITNGIVSF